jgi:hypothetical protein
MTRVADLLAGGEMTEEEAQAEIDRINRRLESGGPRITGRLANLFGDEDYAGFSVWTMLLIAAFVIMLVMVVRRRKTTKVYAPGAKPRRRYEIFTSKIGLIVRNLRNKSRQRQYSPERNVPLTRYLEKKAKSERQKTLYESVSQNVERARMKMQHSQYAPRHERRYQAVIRVIKEKINKARLQKRNKAYEERQKHIAKELSFRKAKPMDFMPKPPKQKPRIVVALAALRKRLHESMLRRKVSKHIHKEKVKERGHTHTRVKASDLFSAIDEYKHDQGIYEGTLREAPETKIPEDYENIARTAVLEENKAVTGLRNAIRAVNDTGIPGKVGSAISKIPKPKLPRLNIKRKVKSAGQRMAVGSGRLAIDIKDIVSETKAKAEEKIKEIKERPVNIDSATGNAKPKDKIKQKAKPKKAKKKGKRRYQAIAGKIRKNFADRKRKGHISLLKDSVDEQNIAERVANVENVKPERENDKIKYLAWNFGKKGGNSASTVVKKAYPSEKDGEGFQSTDAEIDNTTKDKKQAINRLKDIYDK